MQLALLSDESSLSADDGAKNGAYHLVLTYRLQVCTLRVSATLLPVQSFWCWGVPQEAAVATAHCIETAGGSNKNSIPVLLDRLRSCTAAAAPERTNAAKPAPHASGVTAEQLFAKAEKAVSQRFHHLMLDSLHAYSTHSKCAAKVFLLHVFEHEGVVQAFFLFVAAASRSRQRQRRAESGSCRAAGCRKAARCSKSRTPRRRSSRGDRRCQACCRRQGPRCRCCREAEERPCNRGCRRKPRCCRKGCCRRPPEGHRGCCSAREAACAGDGTPEGRAAGVCAC